MHWTGPIYPRTQTKKALCHTSMMVQRLTSGERYNEEVDGGSKLQPHGILKWLEVGFTGKMLLGQGLEDVSGARTPSGGLENWGNVGECRCLVGVRWVCGGCALNVR